MECWASRKNKSVLCITPVPADVEEDPQAELHSDALPETLARPSVCIAVDQSLPRRTTSTNVSSVSP